MADPARIIARLRAHGANIEIIGDGLRIVNRQRLPAGSEDYIAQHRAAIAKFLKFEEADASDAIEERAAIIEFDGHTPREWAEQFARLLAATPSTQIDRYALPWFLDRCGEILDASPFNGETTR